MFSYVVASLGGTRLIKQEDSGEVISDEPNLRIPDFRVVPKDGEEFLVEVKNCRRDPRKPFVLTGAYLSSLESYARLVDRPLRIAIYWSLFNMWTLLSLAHIPRQDGDGWVPFDKAIKRNEMVDLGDMQIATIPPLVLRVVADPQKPRSIDSSGTVNFTIGGVDMLAGGVKIEDKDEKNLAFYFWLNGLWGGDDPKPFVQLGELIHIDYEVAPHEPVEEQGFQMMGNLSQMISRHFDHLTAPDGEIQRLAPLQDPDSLGVIIPPDYKGKQLRLWRFLLQPNYK
jgi:hypothetical protein